MNKFSGIDLHSNNSVVVVSDETDQIVYQRRHANDLAAFGAPIASIITCRPAPFTVLADCCSELAL
jgi:hypothetical protein